MHQRENGRSNVLAVDREQAGMSVDVVGRGRIETSGRNRASRDRLRFDHSLHTWRQQRGRERGSDKRSGWMGWLLMGDAVVSVGAKML